ncbi:retron St85 family effector protein [Bifidobacterium sp. ESL0732]|uniref:retron St85 family effector protein n=1 Tax=Bifidobacterium sp. ESL0732 TaxID=2983222 RepID=UPI0023F868B1|nr:retron St85 family effector protein [Bifidobacterium sp. ESL0732]WEV64537.1 retron St85 family effector protein [Bifidobacterium sp. ESL0732]
MRKEKRVLNPNIYPDSVVENLSAHLDPGNDGMKKPSFEHSFVFICGKQILDKNGNRVPRSEQSNTNRYNIADFITRQNSKINIVFSEDFYNEKQNLDLLTFEEFLAEVCDLIILPVESAGTICELGAFSHSSEELNKKLVILVEKEYENNKSFIVQGPIEKSRNAGASILYAPVKDDDTSILSLNVQTTLKYRLSTLLKNRKLNNPKSNPTQARLDSFVHEIMDLLLIASPISLSDLMMLYREVKGYKKDIGLIMDNENGAGKRIKIKHILAFLESANLASKKTLTVPTSKNHSRKIDYYYSTEILDKNQLFLFNRTISTYNALQQQRVNILERKYRFKDESVMGNA